MNIATNSPKRGKKLRHHNFFKDLAPEEVKNVRRLTFTEAHALALLQLETPKEVKNVSRRTFSEGYAAELLQLETPEQQMEAFREWQKAPVTVNSKKS